MTIYATNTKLMKEFYFILVLIVSLFPKAYAQDECKNIVLSNFIGYSLVGNNHACNWKFEDYNLHLPVFSGGQICRTNGAGVPYGYSVGVSATGTSYIEITCNIPIGKVIKICGSSSDKCLSITFNGQPVSDCSYYYVQQSSVTNIDIMGQNCVPFSIVSLFEVCDPYIKHFYTSPNTDKLLGTAFLAPNSEVVEFKITADGTQSSRFTLNLPTQKLRIKENPDSQLSEEIYGSLVGNITSGEYSYKHPSYIPIGGSQTLHLEVLNENDQVIKEIPLALYQPPLLMVHGMWGNPNKFGSIKSSLQSNYGYQPFQLKALTYESNAAFTQSGVTIDEYISGRKGLINRMLKEKIACGKVDILTHSLGGLVARSYLQLFGNEHVHKLITIATPHSGSQIANVLHDPDFEVLGVCEFFEGCGPGTAVNSLRVNSDEIIQLNSLSEPSVPSHAIVAQLIYTGNDIEGNLDWPVSSIALNMGISLPLFLEIFNGSPNDGMVTTASQAGGLTGDAVTYIAGVNHTEAPFNQLVIAKIGNLLKGNPQSSLFQEGFAPPLEIYNDDLAPIQSSLIANVEVISPLENQIANWGDNVEFNINIPSLPGEIATIYIGVDNGMQDNQNVGKIIGESGSITIPMKGDQVGTTKVWVFAIDTMGKTVANKSITIFVNVDKVPNKITLDPDFDPGLPIGDTDKFFINADFDELSADISELSGITYSFTNSNVEYIGSNTIVGLELGETEMTATFNGTSSQPIPIIIVSKDSTTTSTDDLFFEKQTSDITIEVSPNPNFGLLNIKYESDKDMRIDIYNLLGQLIHQYAVENLISGETQIDVSHVKPGPYILTLRGDHIFKMAKFIKE